MEPVDLVILDTVEHIGEVGLRIEAQSTVCDNISVLLGLGISR